MAQLSSIVPKLHLRLMPVLLMMYVMAFLDRANVSFAKAGLAADVGIGNAAFAFGASIFFVGYALLEVPSNLALHRFGARRWMARIMITWGIVSAANAFVTGPNSFYAVRFLLGMTEAGFFPGVIYYMTYWYPTSARARSVGLFYYGAPLALTFGGPISGALVAHDAFGLHGWQVMFLIEGLLASLGGIAVLFLLHDRPEQAPWLNADEKVVLRAALTEDEGAREHPGVLRALRDGRVLYLALVYFLVEMGFYGLTFYLPTQVARLLGTSIGLEVGLVTSLPWICALIAVTIVPPWCDRKGNARGIGALTAGIAGIALAISALTPSPLVALIALCVAAAGLIVSPALFWTLPTRLLGGAAAAGGIALINSIGNLGGFAAPNLRAWLDALFANNSAALLGLGGVCVLGAVCFAFAPRRS
ncbi:MAG: MFS transporter [Alphaproteobacteria bacterium]|nr:MFS transporter [Alphaproteobacteria bacterium]